MWFIIELNIVLFIPLHDKFNVSNYNNLIKYFLIQRISSSLIILLIFTQINFKFNNYTINLFLNLVLWIKLGIFPFRSWYFQITENINWKIWFLINTAQKIIPIWLLTKFNNIKIINLIITINRIYRRLEIYNNNSIRWLLNRSSLNHIRWILVSINSQFRNWEFYMLIYLILRLNIILFLKNYNLKINININNIRFNIKILFSINLINFIGIPPIIGFLPKFLVLIRINTIMSIWVLVLNNILIRYYYILIIKSSISNKIITSHNQKTLSLTTNLSIISLLLIGWLIITI